MDADFNQFEESQTANRIVLTVGKFYQTDIFETNKYANNPKSDFQNWTVINNGAYDFGSDSWSDSYGVAAEWYQGHWTWRAGIFDMAQTPADVGGDSALGYGLSPNFHNFQMVGEAEYRYSLWDQPGKVKLTGFLIRGDMGTYTTGIAFAQATGLDVGDALAAVRTYQSRPGILFNFEQQVMENVGAFGRAGWADGQVETARSKQGSRSAARFGTGRTIRSASLASSMAFPRPTPPFSPMEAMASSSATARCVTGRK